MENDNVVFIQRKILAKRKIFFGISLGVVLFLLLFLLFYFLPILAVRDVQVSGSNNSELQLEVQNQLLNNLKGVSALRVNERMVLDNLQNFPLIGGVSISFDLPDVLKVNLYERTPLAVIDSGDGFAVVDADGNVLEVVSSRELVALPLIVGEAVYFDLMVEVLQSLPNTFLNRVDRVEMSSMTTVKLFLRDGSEVIWGDSANSSLKAQILDILVSQMSDRIEISIYDVSTPNAPITK